MQGLFPPLCLLLAFALAVCGFAIWAREGPEAGTDDRVEVRKDVRTGLLLNEPIAFCVVEPLHSTGDCF